MYIFFADDSEQKSPMRRDGLTHLIGYGGVLIPPNVLGAYSKFLDELRVKLEVPANTEFKWCPEKGSPLYGRNGLQKIARESMLDAAIKMGIRSVVVITDLGRIPAWNKDDAEREMLKYLYERVSGALTDLRDIGLIIADEPGGGNEKERQWLAESLKLTSNGTEYVTTEKIVLPIMTVDSKHVQNLQLADLVIGASTSAVSGSRYGLAYIDRLKALAHKNSAGCAAGTGIKLCPDAPWNPRSIVNLHRWVFKENLYWKVGRNAGIPLPCSEWSFYENGGLPETAS